MDIQSFQNNSNIVQSHSIRLIYLIFLYFTLLSFQNNTPDELRNSVLRLLRGGINWKCLSVLVFKKQKREKEDS